MAVNAEPPVLPPRQGTALVVEDEELLRTAVACRLAEKFAVYQAANGIEALALLERTQVDLVVTDLAMPQMNGFQLIEAIRQRWPDIRVVLWSGTLSGRDRRRAQELHVDAVVEKPGQLETLDEVVQNVLRIH